MSTQMDEQKLTNMFICGRDEEQYGLCISVAGNEDADMSREIKETFNFLCSQ